MKDKIFVFEHHETVNEWILKKIDLNKIFLKEININSKFIRRLGTLKIFILIFYFHYFCSVNVMVSTIINSHLIKKIKFFFPKIKIISIQSYLMLKPELKKIDSLYHDKILFFGPNQYQNYIQHNHKLLEFEFIGSLNYAIHRKKNIRELNPNIKIGYISQWTPEMLKKVETNNDQVKNILDLEKNLKRYLSKFNLSYCVLMRSNKEDKEFNYLKKNFDKKNIFKRNSLFDNYKKLDQCQVIVSWCSTLAYEFFADNFKTVFFSNDKNDFLINSEINNIIGNDYYNFEKKINYIMKLDSDIYKNLTFKIQNTIISKSDIYETDNKIIKIIKKKIN